MEDRKRPAIGAVDDMAPPSKRQAINGGSKSKDDTGESKEEAWIEDYQKGAIYRRMLEYKREKTQLETRVQELEKGSAYHDDHIRAIDAWMLQVLQELQLSLQGSVSVSAIPPNAPSPFSLGLRDNKDFQRLLGDKAKAVKDMSDSILQHATSLRGEVHPDVTQLEVQIKNLLAAQKDLLVKIDRLERQNASLSEQYDTATLKVIKAERKLDRVKSAQVQKLEQQALANATSRPTTDENGPLSSETNGDYVKLKTECEEATAVLDTVKAQLDAARSEIQSLREENTDFKVKKEVATDEEFVRTELFKQLKSQNEEFIKRINSLEAVNKSLREDMEKSQAERVAFRTQLQLEAQAVTSELEDQIQQKEQDLTRIRSARDEIFAELSRRKATQERERTDLVQLKELVQIKDDRIEALEAELGRLRPSEDVVMMTAREDLEALSTDDLIRKHVKLEKDFESINKEIPLLEKSYKKSAALAHSKVMDFSALEERVALLAAEKAKADQKYFAARRDNDVRAAELRALRMQNGKSSETISQLKDVEMQKSTLISNLEKQLAELRQSNSTVAQESKRQESLGTEANRRMDSARLQIADLTALAKHKDAQNAALRGERDDLAQENSKLEKDKTNLTSERDGWKKKALSSSTEEEDMLRKLVLCSVCRNNFKNTFLKSCGHVFCYDCVDARLQNRMRKCPTCNKAFDKSDAMTAHL